MKTFTINKRIEKLIELKGMNNNSFAVKAKILPQSLGNVINGKSNSPTFGMLESILNAFPDISSEWLMRNKGEPIINPLRERQISLEEHNKLIEQFNNLKKDCGSNIEIINKLKHTEEMVSAQEKIIESQNAIINLLKGSK